MIFNLFFYLMCSFLTWSAPEVMLRQAWRIISLNRPPTAAPDLFPPVPHPLRSPFLFQASVPNAFNICRLPSQLICGKMDAKCLPAEPDTHGADTGAGCAPSTPPRVRQGRLLIQAGRFKQWKSSIRASLSIHRHKKED